MKPTHIAAGSAAVVAILMLTISANGQKVPNEPKTPTTCSEAYNYMVNYFCDSMSRNPWCKPRQAQFRAQCMETGRYVTMGRSPGGPGWENLKKE